MTISEFPSPSIVDSRRLMGPNLYSDHMGVVLEATAIAVFGSIVGVGFGALTSWIVNAHYQSVYRSPVKFSIVTGDVVLLAVSLSLVLGIVAGWLAARRLVRTPPLMLFGR